LLSINKSIGLNDSRDDTSALTYVNNAYRVSLNYYIIL